jgi:hypothetical protein
VPLIAQEVIDPAQVEVDREDQMVIYQDLIIPDLVKAAENLPAVYDQVNEGRVTSWAAKALLAKVYLTLGGSDPAYYQLAKETALEVVEGPFSLMPDYENLFKIEHEFNQESIFEINFKSGAFYYYFEGFGEGVNQPQRNGVGSYYNLFFSPRFRGVGRLGSENGAFSFGGYGFNIPTTSNDPRSGYNGVPEGTGIVEAYPEGDLRKDVTILNYREAAAKLGVPIDENISPYNVKKYADFESGINGESDDNYYILRLADIYLLLAEAENEVTGGPTALAYEYLNKVRRRAFGKPVENPSVYDLSGLSYQEFLDAVYKERRLELAFEGQRWFDLVRRPERAIATMKAQGKEQINLDRLVMPIPQVVIDEMNGLIEQNQAWK